MDFSADSTKIIKKRSLFLKVVSEGFNKNVNLDSLIRKITFVQLQTITRFNCTDFFFCYVYRY